MGHSTLFLFKEFFSLILLLKYKNRLRWKGTGDARGQSPVWGVDVSSVWPGYSEALNLR